MNRIVSFVLFFGTLGLFMVSGCLPGCDEDRRRPSIIAPIPQPPGRPFPCPCDTCYVIPPGHRESPADSLSCEPHPPGQRGK